MGSGVGVDLEDLTIRFGDFTAVSDADVGIEGGEFFSFLGPSGCGKTTILRAVSGFLDPSEGRVLIGGKDMAGIGPNKRPTALIFQNLALFPLMKVWENIAFSMEVAGASAAERRKRADELLELVALDGPGRQAAARTLRRPAPARGDRPRALRRARRAVARRAALGARSEAAPAHAHRTARDPAARRHHLHLHHPRPGRGAHHVRPGGGDEGGGDRAGRHRQHRSTTAPRPPSSPRSSARTTSFAARSCRSAATRRWSAPTARAICARRSRPIRSASLLSATRRWCSFAPRRFRPDPPTPTARQRFRPPSRWRNSKATPSRSSLRARAAR